MILRVLDFYKDFHCIADKCKDSCCIGWEIDIDEDTYEYYRTVPGKLGQRLKENIYQTDEGDYSFCLAKNNRCPFLNGKNLCDICSELGEEAFSEVCTEYPRFSVYYGDVLQKTLALSCEEVGRIFFTKEDRINIVDVNFPSEEDFEYEGDADDETEENFEENPKVLALLEKAQTKLIEILQSEEDSFEKRLKYAFAYAASIQKKLNLIDSKIDETDEVIDISEEDFFQGDAKQIQAEDLEEFSDLWEIDKEKSIERFYIFEQMETLDSEWDSQKDKLRSFLEIEEKKADSLSYETVLNSYLKSDDYRELDYARLMVYFTFRYVMTASLDYNLALKVRLALEFSLLLRDMAAIRFSEKGGHFLIEDMIDIARIFSKEVEHSEENVEFAQEEFIFLK